MTTATQQTPNPFTQDDYAARMSRVVDEAVGAGLTGVIVAPGPDLVWLTGYQPTAITERLTMLVLTPDREPTLVVPTLERPDAESAEGAGALPQIDRAEGSAPNPLAGSLLRADGRVGGSGPSFSAFVVVVRPSMYRVSPAAVNTTARWTRFPVATFAP